MRPPLISVIWSLVLLAGCAGQSSLKPVEALDDRTGMTVATLKEPIELVPRAQNPVLLSRKHMSLAFLGPVEWNRSGSLSYGLWVHIVPGIDSASGDIHAPGALTLILEDGPLALTATSAPLLGREPYRRVASWGQTEYFGLDVESLKRMARSHRLELEVHAADGSRPTFSSTVDSGAIFTQYLRSRGITDD